MKTVRYFTLFLLLVAMTLPPSSLISAAGPAKNLAPNPSFEKANREKTQPAGWWGNNSYWTYSWIKGDAFSGKYSICTSNVIENSSGEWMNIDAISVTGGATYTLSAYVKGDLDREVYISIWPVDADGNWLMGSSVYTTFNNSTWTFAEVVYKVPANATGVYLALGVNNPGTLSTGTICYDFVTFK